MSRASCLLLAAAVAAIVSATPTPQAHAAPSQGRFQVDAPDAASGISRETIDGLVREAEESLEIWKARARARGDQPPTVSADQLTVLQKSRIRVTVDWRSQYTGQTGRAFALPQDDGFAFFYFSDQNNPEVFVKVLDFGSPDPFLVFYAGLTDFEYTVTFENLCTGQKVTRLKPAGSPEGGFDNKALSWCTPGSPLAISAGVSSLNGGTGDLSLSGSGNVTVGRNGQTIAISVPGALVTAGSTNQTLRWGGSSWSASPALTNDGTNVAVSGGLTVGTTLGLPGNVMVTSGGARFLSTAPGFATSTFLGKNAGNPAGETGCCHVAIGEGALQNHTANNSNVAVGNSVMNKATSATQNVGVGTGNLSLLTTGAYNTALGDGALAVLSTGGQNTAIGGLSLNKLAAGENLNNIAVGIAAGTLLETGNSNIYIGNPGTKTESVTTRIGDVQNRTFIAGIRGITTGSTGAIPVVIDANGQLGTVSSSIRFKDDVRDLGDGSSTILHLRPVSFRYKAHSADPNATEYGLIAEEVSDVMPALAVQSPDGQIETVKYDQLPVLLLNELQKAVKRIEDLEREVQTLRNTR